MKESNMKRTLILAMSAVLLTFGIISCDTPTTTLPTPPVPAGLVGVYATDGHIVVIHGHGPGTVNGFAASFAAAGNVLTVTMLSQTVTVDFNISNGAVNFSNVSGNRGTLRDVFGAFVAAEPITPGPVPVAGAIPSELVGAWVLVNQVATPPLGGAPIPADTQIFVINSDGSGTVRNEVFATHDVATWSVSGSTITLTIDYTHLGAGIMRCSFTWSIAGGNLTFSNAVPADPGSAVLAGYAAYGSFTRGEGALAIADFPWTSTVPADFTGTWEATANPFYPDVANGVVIGRRIFAIRSNGTGYLYRTAIPGFDGATFQFATSGGTDYLLLTLVGFGRAMFEISIVNDHLILLPFLHEGNPILTTYALFAPFYRTSENAERPFNYDDFTWHAIIPDTHTGTWRLLPGFLDMDIYTINADGTGTIFVNPPGIHVPAFFAVSTDNKHLLITFPGVGRILFEVSIENDVLTLENVIDDAGGEFMALGYGELSPLVRIPQP